MDATPSNSGELNDVEQRLARWRPAPDGLNVEGMLFAAGRASARASLFGRIAWPTAAGFLAIVAAVFAVGWSNERDARLALAVQLESRASEPARQNYSPETFLPTGPVAVGKLAPDSYLVMHQALEEDPDSWPTHEPAAAAERQLPASPNQPILQVRPSSGSIDQ